MLKLQGECVPNREQVFTALDNWYCEYQSHEGLYQEHLAAYLTGLSFNVFRERRIVNDPVDIYIKFGDRFDLTQDFVIELKNNLCERRTAGIATGQVLDVLTRGAKNVVLLLCGISKLEQVDRVYRNLRQYVIEGRLSFLVKPPTHLTLAGPRFAHQNRDAWPTLDIATTAEDYYDDFYRLVDKYLNEEYMTQPLDTVNLRNSLIEFATRVAESIPKCCITPALLGEALRSEEVNQMYTIYMDAGLGSKTKFKIVQHPPMMAQNPSQLPNRLLNQAEPTEKT